jgi:DNA polymerase III sliding clamp (beta) subunit (PCNA family)
LPEIDVLLNMEFEDPELEPTILPLDARLSLRGSVEEFRRLFERLTAITPQKEKIPGTSYVHVVAEDGVTRFLATDGAQTLILETSSLRINREGKALLPGHKLKTIFSLAPEAGITLTVLANTATLSSGRAVWNISIPAGEKTPAVPDISEVELHTIPRRALHKALTATKRALPGAGGRRSLEQANVAAGAITCSDGYRLIRQKAEGVPLGLSFAIPRDTVDELLRALTFGAEENILLGANDSLIVYKDRGETMVSRRLTLDYPDIESQILAPALENKYSLTVDSHELRDLVKRIRVSADPEYASVTLHFAKMKAGEWELTVLTRDRSGNSASESMYAMWEGDADPFDITLNHKYLTDLLEAYSGSLATLRIGAGTKTRSAPLLLKDDDRGFIAVIQQSIGRQ